MRSLAIAMLFCIHHLAEAQVKHVVLISIDGLHPDMYLDKSWPTPNLQLLVKKGTYADYCLSVFPAYTHPSHAAMTTGALPARSGIAYNQPLNSKGEWNWYYNTIKAPTIWQALKDKGMTTAAIMWPNVVDGPITYNLSEIWDENHPNDRATPVRQHAIPKGIYEEIERNATGKLDSTNMNDNYFSLDENTGRMAAYIFKTYKPSFLALHFACVDGEEHEFGRDADSVRLAIESNDRAIGEVMQAIEQSGLKESTTIIIVGDHGFSNIHTIMRPNMLIKGINVKFIAAGGSCFLYRSAGTEKGSVYEMIKAVTDSLDKLPKDKRRLFRIIDRKELDKMGADSSALMALSAVPGIVFSGSTRASQTENHGPGTLIQQSKYDGVFIPTTGGHHGYDPAIPDMWTGFIAYGADINRGGHIREMRVVDISPLIAKLLGIKFQTPDGKLVPGILNKL
ncbi:MAG: alkaline phosphatase family protein [Mucilaginibacter sp.]|nr:alkaline phosphatase family protein [Mucilaginibacter sp.]